MKRIIINFDDEIEPLKAIELVYAVVKQGRVSNNGKNYCYGTEFTNGYVVWTDRNSDVSDTFRIRKALEG